MKHILSFDLESWYDSEFIKDKNGPDFVEEGLKRVLILLDRYNTKATFFVTGHVCATYPGLVKQLYLQGHEIASHSYEHKMLSKISNHQIEENILRSKKIIKQITGKNPIGFRAPSWSLKKEQRWVYELLKKEGFSYSSSLFPINVGAYGSFSNPLRPFRPLKDTSFVEFPITPYTFGGIRIPFSGGVYFRILPKWIIGACFKRMNKQKKRVIIYIHPWELCTEIPRVRASLVGKIISYWGLHTTKPKLEYLLKRFKFDSFENELNRSQ